MDQGRSSFGIVGGLSPSAAGDLHAKLAREGSRPALVESVACVPSDPVSRKIQVFEAMRSLERRGVSAILLPCFLSQGFLAEFLPELRVPVVDLLAAMGEHVHERHPGSRSLGVLATEEVNDAGLFERRFGPVLHPRLRLHESASLQSLMAACRELVEQGAQLILTGCTEFPPVLESWRECPVPIVDCNQVYAEYALGREHRLPARPAKVGIVGGVGPAATVDFLAKLVRNTPAHRDQDHLKVVVEQNPQIPDRTGHLLGGGPDPTIALYATCKKLEAAGADLIAIPCNTAHAFVERLQPHLGIPIVHMVTETLQQASRSHPNGAIAGLLATDGTVRTRLYHRAAEQAGIRLVVPDETHQRRVMEAIYGQQGVKAGFTEGRCKEDLLAAMEHLVRDQGAELLILGCTELPLLVAHTDRFPLAGRFVPVLDPTEILARRCVELAKSRT